MSIGYAIHSRIC